MNPLEHWRWRRGSKRHLEAITDNIHALVIERDEARIIADGLGHLLMYQLPRTTLVEAGLNAWHQASWRQPDARD